jgi:hypothetical protein
MPDLRQHQSELPAVQVVGELCRPRAICPGRIQPRVGVCERIIASVSARSGRCFWAAHGEVGVVGGVSAAGGDPWCSPGEGRVGERV